MTHLLDKKQVAELLKISVKTLDMWLSRNTGPKPIRLGRLVRFSQSDVQAFIQNLSSEGS
jgi:excisionase family DNA binding protein